MTEDSLNAVLLQNNLQAVGFVDLSDLGYCNSLIDGNDANECNLCIWEGGHLRIPQVINLSSDDTWLQRPVAVAAVQIF